MSASTSWRSSESSVPSTGSTVVKGYSATFGRGRVSRRSSDDLPAFGWPISPASASSFSRSSIHPDSPSRPFSAKRGAWRVELANRLLPCPPSRRRDHRPLAGLDQVVAPPVEALDLGPRRHRDHLVSPRAPWRCLPWPWPPRPARKWRARCSAARSRREGSADQHHVAPAPAVAAVGAAARHVRLAAKADAAVAAAPALDVDPRLVVKHALTT